MHIVYNPAVKGYQIVYTPNMWIRSERWNKSVNGKVYESWDSANHDLDKCAE